MVGQPAVTVSEFFVEGPRIRLRPPLVEDYRQWSELREASRNFLTPWEPTWRRDHLASETFKNRVRWAHRMIQEDRCYQMFAFRAEDRLLVGGITVENICRWPHESASLGYWMGERYAGQGYMTEILEAIVSFAFGALRLSRLEAACVPENDASRALLLRCGFRREGTASAMMQINGAWRDHELYARLAEGRSDPVGGAG